MLSIRSTLLLAVFLGTVLVSCSTTGSQNAKLEKDRKLAPDFTLKDENGKAARLADYRGKVVLLNFWATWCGPCKMEIPWFMDFEQNYKSRGFAVLGVSFDDDGWTSVKPYVADMKINYRIMLGTDQLEQQYGGVDSLPTTFLIDRDGRIAAMHIGLIDKDEYKNEISALLERSDRGVPRGALPRHPGSLAAFLWAK